MSGTKTLEEALKWELHIAYSRGMRDGAGGKAMRKEYGPGCRTDLGVAYGRAYLLGQRLVRAAIEAHAAEIGYVPNVLRVQDRSPRPHDMAAPSGPTCGGCGCPSHHESGWCGDPGCEAAPTSPLITCDKGHRVAAIGSPCTVCIDGVPLPISALIKKRTCNRHDDCDAADADARRLWKKPASYHCHIEDCEDCFGC